MMRNREAATGTHADIHEQDQAYLKRCREGAQDVVKLCGWTVVHCGQGDGPRTIEDIHGEVLANVRQLL
jgi:dTMP kinase